MEIDDRVLLASGDDREFEALLTEYRPFIASCACKAAGRFIDEHDDEMSIAIIAFNEAVKRYRIRDGRFLPYAGKVIRCRLIDHKRSKYREAGTIPLDEVEDANSLKNAICTSMESRIDDPVCMEIEELSNALKQYGLRFADVAKCSPKSQKTKKACAAAAKCILSRTELLLFIRKSKKLPVIQIEKISGISRKTLERHRSYIVCLAEILSGEYSCLTEYVKFAQEATT